MTARDVIAKTLYDDWSMAPGAHGVWNLRADAVIEAIRGMSHDELRELRPDIATLYDATRDTANTRGDYIINHTAERLAAVERERDELAAKVARVEAVIGPWHSDTMPDSMADRVFVMAAMAIRAALRGNP